MTTRVLPCDPASIVFTGDDLEISCEETKSALHQAATELRNLQPVAFPTETVYGLGTLALDTTAASRIFSTKGRPPDNPLIVHVSSLAMLWTLLPKDYAIPPAYKVLMDEFWPGALTLLFPSDPTVVPSIITANHPTVAIRMPSHPVARALIAMADAPIAAPSANSSGKPSPTKAEHVLRDLNGKISIILDGGSCGVGLESTVVDGLHEDGKIRVLRPGGVTVEDIEKTLCKGMQDAPGVLVHRRDYSDEVMEHAPTTPGMKYRHYSPSVPVTLLLTSSKPPAGVEPTLAPTFLKSLAGIPRIASAKGPVTIGLLIPDDSRLATCELPAENGTLCWRRFLMGPTSEPAETARRLFDGLLTLDKEGVDMILIEEVLEEKEGLAVMNRVRKAASETEWIRFADN